MNELGDGLIMFTDGITQASGGGGEEFDRERLTAPARDSSSSSAQELNHRVLAQVKVFCAGQFKDDATILVIAVNKWGMQNIVTTSVVAPVCDRRFSPLIEQRYRK